MQFPNLITPAVNACPNQPAPSAVAKPKAPFQPMANDVFVRGQGAELKFSGKKDQELHRAISNGYGFGVDELVRNRVDLNRVNSEGMTPLLTAIKYNKPKMITRLIDLGANPNQVKNNVTPLHHAAETGRLEVAKALLEGKANSKQDSPYGTPLHSAANKGHTELVKVLIDDGADVNMASQHKGYTALHGPASANHAHTAIALLEAGARADIPSTEGTLPFQLAASGGHTALMAHLAKGHDLDLRAKNGYTALLIAANKGHTETVETLIQMGADINQENKGKTALHEAASQGHAATVKTLLALGANRNICDLKGKPPVHYAKNRKIRYILENYYTYG
jgi:ankyrin repeat protein